MSVDALKERLRRILNNPWLEDHPRIDIDTGSILDLIGTPDENWSPGHFAAADAIIQKMGDAAKAVLRPLCANDPRGESPKQMASRLCAEGLIQKESALWSAADFDNAAAASSDLV